MAIVLLSPLDGFNMDSKAVRSDVHSIFYGQLISVCSPYYTSTLCSAWGFYIYTVVPTSQSAVRKARVNYPSIYGSW